MVKQWKNLSEEKLKKLEKEFRTKTIEVKKYFFLINFLF